MHSQVAAKVLGGQPTGKTRDGWQKLEAIQKDFDANGKNRIRLLFTTRLGLTGSGSAPMMEDESGLLKIQ